MQRRILLGKAIVISGLLFLCCKYRACRPLLGLKLIINMIMSPRYAGYDLRFCTGSHAAAAAGRSTFCSRDDFRTTIRVSLIFRQDWWTWPIDYLIRFWSIFAVALTLSFQGQIWNLLCLSQKWSDYHETKSKHIDWTPGLKCDHRVWPWPWPWKVRCKDR